MRAQNLWARSLGQDSGGGFVTSLDDSSGGGGVPGMVTSLDESGGGGGVPGMITSYDQNGNPIPAQTPVQAQTPAQVQQNPPSGGSSSSSTTQDLLKAAGQIVTAGAAGYGAYAKAQASKIKALTPGGIGLPGVPSGTSILGIDSNTLLIVGGVAVLGIGGYFLFKPAAPVYAAAP